MPEQRFQRPAAVSFCWFVVGFRLIKGDATCLSIAAASIIAKVTRDRMMAALHDEHPHYGCTLAKLKG